MVTILTPNFFKSLANSIVTLLRIQWRSRRRVARFRTLEADDLVTVVVPSFDIIRLIAEMLADPRFRIFEIDDVGMLCKCL